MAEDAKFENARQNSDRGTPTSSPTRRRERAVLGMVRDNTQLFKLFADNPDLRRWLADTAFRLAYEGNGLKEHERPAETSRARFSAPLATASDGPDTFRNVLIRPETLGRFRRVDCLASGPSASRHGDAEAPVQHRGPHFPRGHGRTVPDGWIETHCGWNP